MSYLRYLYVLSYIGVLHMLCFCFVCLRLAMLAVSLHLYCPFGIHLSLFTCFKVGHSYLCMRDIDVSFNNLHNQRFVHFKHKNV